MALWTGFEPQTPTGSTLSQWIRLTPDFFDADGNIVEWWTGPNCGLTSMPINCNGSAVHEFSCSCSPACEDCDACPDVPPLPDFPCESTFDPFWIEHCYDVCELVEAERPVRPRIESEMSRVGLWHGIARGLWKALGSQVDECEELVATALGDDTATCVEQALGILSHARADVGSGILLAPGYLAGAFKGVATRNSSGQLTAANIPLIIDASFDGSGPTGTTYDAPTSGWVYHIDQLPVAAVRPPVFSRIDGTNGCTSGCCVLDRMRQQAIVAFNTCRVYAIKVETCCSCC